ncbi:hypothetical protein NL676_014240 [Syzygium grande]|nr:hypothetical protein NL676_014240 [Syzygium grande]
MEGVGQAVGGSDSNKEKGTRQEREEEELSARGVLGPRNGGGWWWVQSRRVGIRGGLELGGFVKEEDEKWTQVTFSLPGRILLRCESTSLSVCGGPTNPPSGLSERNELRCVLPEMEGHVSISGKQACEVR